MTAERTGAVKFPRALVALERFSPKMNVHVSLVAHLGTQYSATFGTRAVQGFHMVVSLTEGASDLQMVMAILYVSLALNNPQLAI